jgi:hypothetical protein
MKTIKCLGTYFDIIETKFLTVYQSNKSISIFTNKDTFESIFKFAKFIKIDIQIIESDVFVDKLEFIEHLKKFLTKNEYKKLILELDTLI